VDEHVSEQRPTTEPAAATTPVSSWTSAQVRTDEIRSEAKEEEQYTKSDDIVAQVSAALAAKKRRSSFDKGEWGLAR
jgi:hypothetical protein